MSNLLEIAELAWEQVFPSGGDETRISKESFIATAKTEYAYQYLLFYWKQKREEGFFNIPSHLLSEVELPVVDDEIDISKLKVFNAFGTDRFLVNVGGLTCSCEYVKSNVNTAALLCDDDSLSDDTRTYLIVGNKIKFPRGTHASRLTIIYTNTGEKVSDRIECDDAIGGIVRTRLVEIYGGGKTGKEDDSNNSTSNS